MYGFEQRQKTYSNSSLVVQWQGSAIFLSSQQQKINNTVLSVQIKTPTLSLTMYREKKVMFT